ncbi:uncharacterized protein [Equus przewalskii]|uniref:Uncharacterized protein n=1 Tax=Equus przewalskii TaxID=9798 RepID=A0ABM4K5A6_EQUPR
MAQHSPAVTECSFSTCSPATRRTAEGGRTAAQGTCAAVSRGNSLGPREGLRPAASATAPGPAPSPPCGAGSGARGSACPTALEAARARAGHSPRGRPPPSLSRSVPWPCRKCGLRLFGATAVALGTWRSDPLWSRAHLKEETLRCVSFCFPLPPLGRPACWGPRTARPVAGSSAEEERPASCNLGQSRLLKRSASLPIPRLRSFYKY